jgi:hypothetical protein
VFFLKSAPGHRKTGRNIYVPALIESVYGSRRWMAMLGKKGGRAKTAAKRKASRANGAKGGRPKRVIA